MKTADTFKPLLQMTDSILAATCWMFRGLEDPEAEMKTKIFVRCAGYDV